MIDQDQQRDPADEAANRAEMEEPVHCIMGAGEPDEWGRREQTSCTDVDGGGDCVHCPCCCACMGCLYGPRDGMLLTAEQRAPIAAVALDYDDVPPNAGSAS